MEENYEKILERISRASDLDKEELNRRVEAKRSKLSGLISREGALQVIAAELGISFDDEKLMLLLRLLIYFLLEPLKQKQEMKEKLQI